MPRLGTGARRGCGHQRPRYGDARRGGAVPVDQRPGQGSSSRGGEGRRRSCRYPRRAAHRRVRLGGGRGARRLTAVVAGDLGGAGELTKSFDGAEGIAHQYPQHAQQIIAAARQSFVHGQDWAYAAGIVAVALGAVLVFVAFPGCREEKRLLAEYHSATSPSAARPERLIRPE